ncbi:MAG: outer membrane beta-barrel protein [Phycisphaerae bacterium]|nr:outer membrane beta-barrel protein [Phycisphaerae bacterium]
MQRSLRISMAIAAAMAGAGLFFISPVSARAANSIPATDTTVSLDSAPTSTATTNGMAETAAPVTPAATPENQPLLMYAMGRISDGNGSTVGQDMDNAGIKVGGYLDIGYTTSFQNAPRPYGGSAFNTEKGNNIQLDQVGLYLEKVINFANPAFRKRGWDIGGKIEMIYGSDADLIHANGLNFYHSWANNTEGDPLDQFDLEQAYLDFGVPIGAHSGVLIRAGKFDTPFGLEQIDPVDNLFYSHSLAFGHVLPYTLTGITAKYIVNQQLSFIAGFDRGNNQALNDDNSMVSWLAGACYKPNSQWMFKPGILFGPEDAGSNGYYRTVGDMVTSWHPKNILNGRLTLANDTNLGYDGAGATLADGYGSSSFLSPGSPGLRATSIGTRIGNAQSACWFDTAFYASYHVNSYLTINGRAEYIYDGKSFIVPTGTATTVNAGEFTIGASITPFPNANLLKSLKIRPEIREDLADHRVLQGGGSAGKHQQTFFAVDAVYAF